MLQRLSIILTALGILAFALPSTAAAAKSIVVHIDGPEAASVREKIGGMLPTGLKLGQSEELFSALEVAGYTRGANSRLGVSADLRSAIGNAASDALTKAGMHGAVIGQVIENAKKLQLRVMVLTYNKGAAADSLITIGTRKKRNKRWRMKLGAIRGAIEFSLFELTRAPDKLPGSTKSASSSGDGDGDDGDDDGDDDDEDDEKEDKKRLVSRRYKTPKGVAMRRLYIGIIGEGGGRDFKYTTPITENLRPYSLSMYPRPGLAVELYPAMFRRKAQSLAPIGLAVSYVQAVGLSSEATNQDAAAAATAITTTWSRLLVDLRYRLELGDAGHSFSPYAGIGKETFSLEVPAGDPLETELPGVDYMNARVGAEFSIAMGKIGIVVHGEYLLPLSTGTVGEDFFPTGTAVTAFNTGGKVNYQLNKSWHFQVGGYYSQYSYTFTSAAGDIHQASGAKDVYYAGTVGLIHSR